LPQVLDCGGKRSATPLWEKASRIFECPPYFESAVTAALRLGRAKRDTALGESLPHIRVPAILRKRRHRCASPRQAAGAAQKRFLKDQRLEFAKRLDCGDFSTALRPPEVNQQLDMVPPPGSAAEDGALQRLRSFRELPGKSLWFPPAFPLVLPARSVIQIAVSNPFRLGVLGSGKGSNFVAMADVIAAGKIPAEVALVLSDVENAGILAHARERKIPARFIPPGKFRTKLDEDAERAFVAALQAAQVDLIVLAGFMRVLKGDFLRAFEGRIVNIHPSLVPSFPGLEAWKQALDHGVKVTGCTVHFVDAGVDSGAIIGQQTVPVLDDDTPESLHQRIHTAEHELYPRCVAAIARGEISVTGRRVMWKK
jgi:phosphoribosylglycinamide formyltransferase 1